MFTANMYVDVWRPFGDTEYSEYSETPAGEMQLVYRAMPIHITPFRPTFTETSRESWQSTKIIANTRRNYILRVGDQVRTTTGREFVVHSVEPTDGAFYGNSIIYLLIENNSAL